MPTLRNPITAAITAVVAAPFAAALTAFVWQWPIFMVGVQGGTGRAAVGAAYTSVLYLVFGGVVVVGGLSAGAGYLLRRRTTLVSIAAGLAVAIGAAIAVPYVADRVQDGPAWIYVHVGGFDDHQTTLGGQVRAVETPAVGVAVTIRRAGESSATTTGSQGWAMLRVPRGEYTVETPCGRRDVEVKPGDQVAVTIYCK